MSQTDNGGNVTTGNNDVAPLGITRMGDMREVKLPPPIWNPENKSYEDFRFQVELWNKACEKAHVEKGDRGYKLYDKLKDIQCRNIGEKIIIAVRVGDIDPFSEEAVDQILKTLDKNFKKDDLSTLHNSWSSFIKLKRKKDEKMDDYIDAFERKVTELKRDGIKLPVKVLAMQLIDSAMLTDKETQIVLTGVNYDDADNMYDQAIRALRKFFGEQVFRFGMEGMRIKQEVDEVEDVNLSYSRNSGRGRAFRGGQYNRGHNNYNEQKPFYNNNFSSGSGRRFQSGHRGGQRYRGGSRKLNPTGPDGNTLTCRICNSVFHFAGPGGIGCPESYENLQHTSREEANEVEDVINEALMSEVKYDGLLDSCCSANVMGMEWKSAFFEAMSEKDRGEIRRLPTTTKFKFGGEKAVSAVEKYEFPCYISGERTTMMADVVHRDIPLLISKPEMKKRGFKLNLEDDSITVNGKRFQLDTTATGHLRLPLGYVQEVNIADISEKSPSEKRKIIMKLHRQFYHPPSGSFKMLMKNAGEFNKEIDEIINNIEKNCDFCLKYRKTKARPVVSMPLAKKFNHVVAMDLKHFGKEIYFIHFIDLYTRFCKAKVIRRKVPSVVLKAFITEWIAMGFGAPTKILIDNGGEFNNKSYTDALEQYNIEPMSTGAYSPWSNGTCERNHAVVDVIVQKVLEENPKIDIEMALANAVSAKNCLMNHNGFAPVQLVTGQLPNLPSVLVNKVPGLEDPEDEVTRCHLEAMHSARRAFIQAESSERIRRALRHPIRCDEEIYVNGDKVLYKRNDDNRWRGPAKVIGQDGKVVFLRYGAQIIRAATCRVAKMHSETASCSKDEMQDKEVAAKDTNKSVIFHDETTTINNDADELDYFDVRKEKQSETVVAPEGSRNLEEDLEENEEPVESLDVPRRSARLAKAKRKFVPEEGIWEEEKQEESAIVNVPMSDHSNISVVEAKKDEMKKWYDFEVIDEVEDKGQKTISTRWVVTEKELADGKKGIKARLVIRGFEEEEDLQVDSPTASKATLRIALAIAGNEGWVLEAIDIKGAFLQGKKIEREVYVEPPNDLKIEGKIWRLRKTVYGLNDAARAWYLSLTLEILNMGCKQSNFDKAAFRYHDNERFSGFIVIHVDDILAAGDEVFKKIVIGKLLETFKIGIRKTGFFKYVGLGIEQDKNDIRLSQKFYVNEISEIDIPEVVKSNKENENQKNLSRAEMRKLRGLSGQILWASSQSRLDACFDSLELSIAKNHATVANIKRANKVVKKLKKTERSILYRRIGDFETLELHVYSDAAFANLPDGVSSTAGYIIFLTSKCVSVCAALDWCSVKIQRKVESTLEAEAIAMKHALGASVYLGHLISEFYKNERNKNLIPIRGFTDNHSLFDNMKSTKQVKSKRLRIDMAEIRRMIDDKELVELSWVPSKEQLADIFTKRDVVSNVLQIVEFGDFNYSSS